MNVMNIVYDTFQPIANKLSPVNQLINGYFGKFSPASLIVGTCVSLYVLKRFIGLCQPRWGETRREQLGRLLLKLDYARKRYNIDIDREYQQAQEAVRKQWEPFQPLTTTLPEEGWSNEQLLQLLQLYSKVTHEAIASKHLSGTVYSESYHEKDRPVELVEKLEKEWEEHYEESDIACLKVLSPQLPQIFKEAFGNSYLWNSLHEEFSIGACLDYQVVNMVAGMFGGRPNETEGFVTSGGTESLMETMRICRNWGMDRHGHAPGQGVIIACESVHAAIEKSCQAYLVNVVYIGCDTDGRADIAQLEKALKDYGTDVIAVVGSAPSYARGVIDPIKQMAELAEKYHVPMHVDCCLGGFIVNNLGRNSDYLAYPGVTSLSADTHKNGLAPKGSSVAVYKDFDGINLAFYSAYTVPNWTGGVYGTPKGAGSQSCVHSLCALLALLAIGAKGYRELAQAVHKRTCDLAGMVKACKGKLSLLSEPDANVVAFAVDKEWRLQSGATYALADEMAKRNVVLNKLHGDAVHFCVTLRFAANDTALQDFQNALNESLDAVKKLNDELVSKGERFAGSAGMYCAINAALRPNHQALTLMKFIENFFFGTLGLRDAIRGHFRALRKL